VADAGMAKNNSDENSCFLAAALGLHLDGPIQPPLGGRQLEIRGADVLFLRVGVPSLDAKRSKRRSGLCYVP